MKRVIAGLVVSGLFTVAVAAGAVGLNTVNWNGVSNDTQATVNWNGVRPDTQATVNWNGIIPNTNTVATVNWNGIDPDTVNWN